MPPNEPSESTTGSSSTSARTTTTKSTRYFGGWADIPEWSDKPGVCYFFDCPSEILDRILSQPIFNIRDHLSLAATCRALRASYYTPRDPSNDELPSSPLWTALLDLRPLPRKGVERTRTYREHIPVEQDATSSRGRSSRTEAQERELDEKHEVLISKICSGRKVDVESMVILAETKRGRMELVRSEEWREALWLAFYPLLDVAEACALVNQWTCLYGRTIIKHSDPTWRPIYASEPLVRYYEVETVRYCEASVEALALRLHGGPLGHKTFVAQKEAARDARRAKKKAATEEQ
ncbi:Rho GTPase-activating protein [Pseudohyphozyma bogoriensis]|nr:Rho GTPase-activating protein [Pseudohyphozyma bogoriensis]